MTNQTSACPIAGQQRVSGTDLTESLRTQHTRVTGPTRLAVGAWVVTAARRTVVNSEGKPTRNDLRLGELDQRSVDLQMLTAFHARLGGKVGHSLVGGDEFRTTVGISAVVQGVHADKDILGPQRLGPAERK